MPWLKAADVLVSEPSSIICQYLAVDRPLVLISNPARFASPHYDQRGVEWRWRDVGEEIHHVDQLAAAVSWALDDPSLGARRRAHYRRELFGDLTDGRAAERLAQHIDELVP
jgi:CDP-glycerol glycerophosphotransferase (TagB/SpsB family)